jgi:hypothetical protein
VGPCGLALDGLAIRADIVVKAPSTVAANFSLVDRSAHVLLSHFTGLVPNKVAVPSTVSGIRVITPSSFGTTLTFLPFLGERQIVRGAIKAGNVEFVLPPIERGAIVWAGNAN